MLRPNRFSRAFPSARVTAFPLLALCVSLAAECVAQTPIQFGRGDRARAAEQVVTLAVQQAIGLLPPAAGQSFRYQYDPKLFTYARSDQAGPSQFRSPATLGMGTFDARLSVSYFGLDETFEPIFYLASDNANPGPAGSTKFGLDVSADVAVTNFSLSYGLLDGLDVSLDVPVVVVDSEASQITAENSAGQTVILPQRFDRSILDRDIAEGRVFLNRTSLSDSGYPGGTGVGLGRINLGVKANLVTHELVELGVLTSVAFASPSSAELAGTDSYAILPRLLVELLPNEVVQVYIDSGYEYDFSFAELRRFVWDFGISMQLGNRASIDAGFGGSVYDEPITWTPPIAIGLPTADFPEGLTLFSDQGEDNEVDTDVTSLLLGGKLGLGEMSVLSAALTVPIDGDLHPEAIISVGIEAYF
jgi:hypothetical protein